MLHLTKVAFGCATIDILRERIGAREANEVAQVHTRYKPTRSAELIGGSLFWIIKHQLVARQTIIGFDEAEEGRKCVIRLDSALVPVRPRGRRAHQGWRYLTAEDAPGDFDAANGDLSLLPEGLARELAALSLI